MLFADKGLEVAGTTTGAITVFETTDAHSVTTQGTTKAVVAVFAIGIFGAILKVADPVLARGETSRTIAGVIAFDTNFGDAVTIAQRTIVVFLTQTLAFNADRTSNIGTIAVTSTFLAESFVTDLTCLAILVGKTTGDTSVGLGVATRCFPAAMGVFSTSDTNDSSV